MTSLRSTGFLARCEAGSASRAELHRFLRQQYQYSRHFTRYLCALLSNLPEERDRVALMQNLFEESGMLGGESHTKLYRRTMQVILGDDGRDEVLPTTDVLVETMLDCCKSPRFMVGLGALCLGAEAIVPEIYTTIVKGFHAVREPTQNLEFFHIHIAGDDDHAVTMREIIVRELTRDPALRLDLEYGAARAIRARVAFFESIGDPSLPQAA